MIIISAALGGLGLFCALYRRTLLGVLIGLQLLILGATTIFVQSGFASGAHVDSHVFGLFIALGGVGQLVAGFAISVRLFYLKKRVAMDELRSLKQ